MVENKVNERRKELGMTLKQLSHESGVPISTIEAVEKGIEPKVVTALKLSKALGRRVEDLWNPL